MRDPQEITAEALVNDPSLNDRPDEQVMDEYLTIQELAGEEGTSRDWPETPSEIIHRYLKSIHDIPDTMIPARTIVKVLEEAATASEHAEVNLIGRLNQWVFEEFFELSSNGYWRPELSELEDLERVVNEVGEDGLLIMSKPANECQTCHGLVSADAVAAETKIHDLVEMVAKLKAENQMLKQRAIAAEIEAGLRAAGFKE